MILETDVLDFINSKLKPKKKEKKECGEVFTPLTLVNEMLDKLDESYTKEHGKSIFTEKDFKWFDPAVGIGNFMVIIYQRLMKGLTIPEEERSNHILKNMLYASEISPTNVSIYKKIFGDNLNIYEGDTLKMERNNFDVIVGNPPFQQGQVGIKKTDTLWDKFIIKCLSLLNPSGYLVFINPSGWRNIDGKFKNVQREILSRDLKYLEIHNTKDGFKTFYSGTRYDWYVLKNQKGGETIIKFQDGSTKTINLSGIQFIPNGEYDRIMSMIAKDEEKVNVLYSRSLYGTDKSHMSKLQTIEYKYPCIYTVNSKGNPTFWYSSKQNGHHVPKLIWSNGGNTGSYIDNGEYGLTQFAYAIVDELSVLEEIKKVFDSKDFRNLMELSTFGGGHINYKIVSSFKKDFWKQMRVII